MPGLDLAGEMAGNAYPDPYAGGGIGLAAPQQEAAAPVIRETDATAVPIPQSTPAAVPTPQTASNGLPQFKDNPVGAVGMILGDLGAALRGKPLPSDEAMQRHRQDQALQLSMVKTGIDALTHIISVSENLPAPARQKFLDAQGTQFEKVLPGFKAQLDAFATQPDSGDLAKILGDYKDTILAFTNGSPTRIREALKSPETMKMLREAQDSANLPDAVSRIGDVIGAVRNSPAAVGALPKGADGKPQITMSTIEQWNGQQPDGSPLKLTPAMLAAARNNQDQLIQVGVTPTKVLEKSAEAAATAGAEVPAKVTFETIKQGLEQNREIAVNAAKLAAKDPQNEFKNANTLRDEYRASSKDFVTVQDAYGKITEAAKSKTGAGDMAMLYAYIKLLDPQTGVREGEFATAAATGSFGEKVQGAVAKIATGERMPDSLRNDFLDQAKKIYGVQQETQKQVAGEYTRIAQRNKIDPNDVIVKFDRDIGNGLRAVPDADLRSRAADPAKLSPSEAAALVSEFKRRGLK